MKNEFKLIVKRDPNGSYEVIEYNESKEVLIERQNKLKQEQPAWEILVVKQNYNVSWKENIMAPNPHYVNMIINFSILGTLIYVAIQVSWTGNQGTNYQSSLSLI